MYFRNKKSLIRILVTAETVVFLWASYVFASDLSLHGFLQGNYSINTSDKNPESSDFKWLEERVQLKLEGNRDPYHLTLRTDVSYDHIDDKTNIDLREGYVDVISNNWDLRLGRQILTWGIGDLIFISDVYPKDYEAFFSGRPMEYLKKGVDGLKIGLYPSVVNLEFVLIPFFEPNTLPRAERFHNAMNPGAAEPDVTFKNTETALRAYRNMSGLDVSLYFYKGFSRMPSMTADGNFFYPKISVYGASMEGNTAGGVIGIEAGYYDSREDREGDNPFVPNSSGRLMMGYKRQLMEDLNIGFQYYADYMLRYSRYETSLPAGYAKENKLYQLTTLRITQMLLHQNLALSFFMFYSPSDNDYLLQPLVSYKFSDNITAMLGANVFRGQQDWTTFARFEKNNNMYLSVRFDF